MIRVGVVSHFPPPPGGMPGQAEYLVKGLLNEGVAAIPLMTNLGRSFLFSKIDSIHIFRTLVRVPVFLLRLMLGVRRAQILHILSCSGLSFFLFTLPSVLFGRLFRRRLILHYHGGGAEHFFDQWPKATAWAFSRVDAVLVPSPFLARIFNSRGYEVHIVPNILDLSKFERQSTPTISPTFIVARHLEPEYNIACALRAFAIVQEKYQDSKLFVLGSGREEATLKNLARELGIAGQVVFLGYVENSKMPETYARASVFLNSSNVDNLPVSILEAFAGGLPVITTRAGGIPDLVTDGITGLLVGLNDHAAMAEKMLHLLENPGLFQQIVSNAHKECKKYAWPEVFRCLLPIYGEALGPLNLSARNAEALGAGNQAL